MIQLWAAPIHARYPNQDFAESTDDTWVVFTRDDDTEPKTYGEFLVANIERLIDPENFSAWWKLIEQNHKRWREEAV